MTYTKKRIVALLIILSLSSIILLSYKVSADISTFDLKDDFEDYINNKIYTEYDNYTLEEYFQDYIEDQAHFTEDREGFTPFGGAIDDGLMDSYYQIICPSDWDGYLTPIMNLTEYPVLEFRIYMDVATEHFYMSMRDYLDNSIGVSPHWTISAHTWTVITWIIPEESRDDIRRGRLGFGSPHDDYPVTVRLDYVKFWKGNYTDYLFQQGDSFDFGEGDKEDWGYVYCSTDITTDEELLLNKSGGAVKSYFAAKLEMNLKDDIDSPFDATFWSYYSIRMKFDKGDYPLETYAFHMIVYDSDGDSIKKTFILTASDNTYNIYTFDLLDYDSMTGTFDYSKADYLRFQYNTISGDWTQTEYGYADYILLFHNDLEDDYSLIRQDTSFYRASKGLRSYAMEDLGIIGMTYYEGFKQLFNHSIKIDIPDVQFFPEKCQFNYYSNVPFNFSLFIDTTEFLLFENKEYLNDWFPIKEIIDRGDYLLNNTEHVLYFELYTFKNTTEYIYIDELIIRYNERQPRFDISFMAVNDSYTDGFTYDMSSNHIHTEPSGEYPFCFGDESDGYEYVSWLPEYIFSRGMSHEVVFKANSTDLIFRWKQITYISADREYMLENYLYIFPEYAINPTHWNIIIQNILYIDGELQYVRAQDIYKDYFLPDIFNFKFTVKIKQEDYNAISCVIDYSNLVINNKTSTPTLVIPINFLDNVTKHSFITMKSNSTFYIQPRFRPDHPDLTYDSNAMTDIKIVRSMKHSPVESENPDIGISDFPIFDSSQPLRSIANAIAYTMERIWELAKSVFGIGGLMSDILKEIIATGKEIKNNIDEMVGQLGGILSNSEGLLSEAGTGNNFLSNILSNMGTGFSNVVSKLTNIFDLAEGDFLDFITNFFDNIISPFSESREEGEGAFGFLGNWGDISDAFQGDDWEGIDTAWGNFFPSMTSNLIENTSNFWGGFADSVFNIPLTDIFDTIVSFWGNFTAWLTLLIIIYLIWMAQLLLRGDWDRMRKEITSIVNIVNWVVSGVVKLIHWIFELIWALLDVLIPFT